MKYIIISTLFLVFASCATKSDNIKLADKDNIQLAVPSAILTDQNIEISQIGF